MTPTYHPPAFNVGATLAANSIDAILGFAQDLVAQAHGERLAALMLALNTLTSAALQFRVAAATPPACQDCDDTGTVVYDGQASPCPICAERALKEQEGEKP